jgi:hypothetical protein
MVENLGEWPFKRRSISKIRPSDGCGRDVVPVVHHGGSVRDDIARPRLFVQQLT